MKGGSLYVKLTFTALFFQLFCVTGLKNDNLYVSRSMGFFFFHVALKRAVQISEGFCVRSRPDYHSNTFAASPPPPSSQVTSVKGNKLFQVGAHGWSR